MVDNIIIEKILISKIASLPVFNEVFTIYSFIGFFKTIRLGGQEGTILITMLMRLNVVATNRIEFNLIGLKPITQSLIQ
jgi:hypothetical protein